MAATSDNAYDIFVWIKKVISSTTTYKQFQHAYNLIELFNKRHNDHGLYRDLSDHSLDHLDTLLNSK